MVKGPIEKVQSDLKRLSERTYRNVVPQLYGQKYSYVFGYTKLGKTVCLGPYSVPHEADSMLATLEDGEVFELDTRSLSRASRVIKAELLSRSGNPDESIRRMLHQKGLEREEGKKR